VTAGSPDPTGTKPVEGDEAAASTWVETVVGGLSDDPSADGAEILDAEVVDAEVVDAEMLDAEVIDADADVVDADVVADEGVAVDEVVDIGDIDLPPSAPGVDDTEHSSAGDISVEDLVVDLERVTAERDQYLDASRRLQAEFENYKKQVAKREQQARDRANDGLIGELLPVLDAFDGAVANGAADVEPMRASFLDALAKQGLERIDPTDGAFDPNLHEAVMHEDAADVEGPVVAEVMRAGYSWKGRVLRPAMVRTRG
jgi:molecular chaperone GrpE